MMLTFIELHPFATVRDKYLDDDEFAALQRYLATHPHAGKVIPRSGGCRKLRWAPEGRGGSDGSRRLLNMRKLPEKELAKWEKTRDLNSELMQALHRMKGNKWARKTVFFPLSDGSYRRVVKRRDGTVEKDDVIPAEKASVAAARASTGMSQAAFAKLLGVSVRTLQEWEQGRKEPSGAAATLLKVAARHPEVLQEMAP